MVLNGRNIGSQKQCDCAPGVHDNVPNEFMNSALNCKPGYVNPPNLNTTVCIDSAASTTLLQIDALAGNADIQEPFSNLHEL